MVFGQAAKCLARHRAGTAFSRLCIKSAIRLESVNREHYGRHPQEAVLVDDPRLAEGPTVAVEMAAGMENMAGWK